MNNSLSYEENLKKAESLYPHFSIIMENSENIIKQLLQKKEITEIPNCLHIESEQEREQHEKFFNTLVHYHRLLGYEKGMKSIDEKYFPSYPSSKNILLSLIYHGYTQATFLMNNRSKYAYIGIPALKNDEFITIIIDPTYQQCNTQAAQIKPGHLRTHYTERNNGSDLYPDNIYEAWYIKKNPDIFSTLRNRGISPHQYFEKSRYYPIKTSLTNIIV